MSADEFETIAKLLAPLTRGHAGALNLTDDAAFLTPVAGQDLVLTQDALVEGVHYLEDDPPNLVARKLLRVNLSDLAAKGARPAGYLLTTAWSERDDWVRRADFVRGLRMDGELFGLFLLGGDTVASRGGAMFSLTMIGHVPSGRMIRRSGAKPGDLLLVSGPIGDGWLGLRAARGEIDDPDGSLSDRYRLPRPRLDLADLVRERASASIDISDGLLADAGHIAAASGLGVRIALDRMPVSPAAKAWLNGQPDLGAARVALAGGGDDYHLAIAAPGEVPGFVAVGRFLSGSGVEATFDGESVDVERLGWRHG